MKNINYEPRTSKYLVLLPIFIILSWFILYYYRIYSWISSWFSAFVSIELWIISPLILIFWWIVLFFIVSWAQQRENKMNNLDNKERQQELRNKLIKEFRIQESREKKHMRFYIIVWILSLTAYVLITTESNNWANDLILFWVWWIFILATQAVRMWNFTKYSKLQKLKIYGKSIPWKILEISKKWKWFLREDTIRYQILAQDEKTWEIYKSFKTRFNLPYYLKQGDKILIYIDDKNINNYFVDIESAFRFEEK